MVDIDSDQHTKCGEYNGDGQLGGLIVQGLGSCLCMLEEITLWLRYLTNMKISPSISHSDSLCRLFPLEVLDQNLGEATILLLLS